LKRWLGVAVPATVALVVVLTPVHGATPKTRRVSVRSNGNETNDGISREASVSATGRYVAFSSTAENLVPNDDNSYGDIFVRDKRTGKTRRVNRRSNGAQADGGGSFDPSISANGRFVVFTSFASNLVRNDDNGQSDIFVHDRETGKTTRVSVRSNGNAVDDDQSLRPSISANGRFVAFESYSEELISNDANEVLDVFVHDRRTGKTRRVSVRSNGSEAGKDSSTPAISANGRFVVFYSYAEDLVNNDDNLQPDIFLHNRDTGKTRRVNVRSNGDEALGGGSFDPAVSAKGVWIAFSSSATNLVPNDGNAELDVFVHNRKTGKTRRVSLTSSGEETETGYAGIPSISGSGRFVQFESDSGSFSPMDPDEDIDIFVHDRKTGKTRRISVALGGGDAGGTSNYGAISRDGRFVAFESDSENLIQSDENDAYDVFLRGPLR
jgi:Tol biopolymer transport system component